MAQCCDKHVMEVMGEEALDVLRKIEEPLIDLTDKGSILRAMLDHDIEPPSLEVIEAMYQFMRPYFRKSYIVECFHRAGFIEKADAE